MSKRADELVFESLHNRWSTTSNPNAGSSCVCSSKAALSPVSRQNMDAITYSIVNQTAAAILNTLSIRNGTATGTVLAQLRIQVPTAQSVQFNGAINLPGKIGSNFEIDISGANASVLQNVSAQGWEESVR